MIKRLILIFVAAAMMLFSGCSRGTTGGYFKYRSLDIFERAVESIGRLGVTGEIFLNGERDFYSDMYTGKYSAVCRNENGKETVFGGTSVKERKIRLCVQVFQTKGTAELKIRLGADIRSYEFESDGFLELELSLDGGANYISVDYRGFSGIVRITSDYR